MFFAGLLLGRCGGQSADTSGTPVALGEIDTAGLTAWLTASSNGMITVAVDETNDADGRANCQIMVSQNEQGTVITTST